MNAPVTRKPPQKAKRRNYIAALDSETDGLDGPFVLGQLYHETWGEARVYYSVHSFVTDLMRSLDAKSLRNTIWYAHNAEYDWRYLISAISALGFNMSPKERAAGKFFEIEILSATEKTPKGKWKRITRLRDSMAVFPRSLKDFTKNFAPNMEKKDIGLGSGVRFDINNPIHMKYAKNDVVALVAGLKRFDELIFENFSVHLAATTSSTAYEAWLRFAPEDEYHDRQPDKIEAFFRKCYHGGLVGLNSLCGHEYLIVETFDINSSYPASMRLGVPKGKARRTFERMNGFPGFYRATANVPLDAILPIVPFRSSKGQLAWQVGIFETFLSSIEIEYAETLGVTFEVHEGYYFPEGITNCFSEFIDVCERLRTEFKGSATEEVVKLMQNSLYGRFGMRLEGRECVIDHEGMPDDFLPVYNPANNETVPDAYYKDIIRSTSYMLPHYSAWITAHSRILIDRATTLAGRENVLYRDTDSVHTVGDPGNLFPMCGKIYGQLKREKPKFNVIYHAPKCYTYHDEKQEWQATYKGVPRSQVRMPGETDIQFAQKKIERDELIRKLHAGEQLEIVYHSSSSLQSFLRTGKRYQIRTRQPTNPDMVYGHRIIQDNEGRRKFVPRLAA